MCQSLHDSVFLKTEDKEIMLNRFLVDNSEYVRKEAVNAIYNLFNSREIKYSKFIDHLKSVFEDEAHLHWRVKYAAIEGLYKCIAKVNVKYLEEPELISLLQVYFDSDPEYTTSIHNIIGLDCIFRWAKKLFISKIEEKFEKS